MANLNVVFGNDNLSRVDLITLSSSFEEEYEEFDLSTLLNDAGRIADELKYDCLLNDEIFPQELEPTPIGPQGILSIASPRSTMDIDDIEDIIYSLNDDNGREHNVASNSVPTPLNNFSSAMVTTTEKVNDKFLPSCFVRNTISYSSTPTLEPVKSIAESDSCYIPPLKKSRISLTKSSSIAVPEDIISSYSNMTSSKHKIPKKTYEHEENDCDGKTKRFRKYQNDQWIVRYEELKRFHDKFGHSVVPHCFIHEGSDGLASWCKRQRFQWKEYVRNKRTTISPERKAKLDELGFIWDSHDAAWQANFQRLLNFKAEHGHVHVPTGYHEKNLSIWVKCQRRQKKLRSLGKQSSLTLDRMNQLDAINFNWNPRNL